jgi:hypothetical protein
MSGSPSPTAVVSPSLLVSLAATPWLVTIATLRATSTALEQLGLLSEEIFRGDRLPVLHVPDVTIAEPMD